MSLGKQGLPEARGVATDHLYSFNDAIAQLMPLFAKNRTRVWSLDLFMAVVVDHVLIVGVDLGMIGIAPASVLANSSTHRQGQLRRRVLRIG